MQAKVRSTPRVVLCRAKSKAAHTSLLLIDHFPTVLRPLHLVDLLHGVHEDVFALRCLLLARHVERCIRQVVQHLARAFLEALRDGNAALNAAILQALHRLSAACPHETRLAARFQVSLLRR